MKVELDRFEWRGFEKKSRIDKNAIKVAIIVLVVLIAGLALFLYIENGNGLKISFETKAKAIKINSTMEIIPKREILPNKYVMTIGEESTIRFSFESSGDGEIISFIALPEGLEYIGGVMQRNESIIKGEIKKLSAYVRAVKVGKWKVEGVVIAGNATHKKSFELCIDVLEEGARRRCM